MAKWDWSKLEWHGPLPDEWFRERAQMQERIEELETELRLMKTAGIIEVSARNASVMEYMKHWERRAEAAEAKLAKATLALDEAIYLLDPDDEDIAKETGLHRIVTIRAELKAEK